MQVGTLRALAAAVALIMLTSNSTSTSALFVAYRSQWGLTPADIALAFSVYVGSLVPVLLLFGGLAERFGRRPVILAGTVAMLAGTAVLLGAHGFLPLIVARLLQGIGAALAVGSISASFSEAYRGRIVPGQALAIVTAMALAFGPVLTAIAYDLGGGTNLSYVPIFVLGILTLALNPAFPGRMAGAASMSATKASAGANPAVADAPYSADVVWRGLRFAMTAIFVGWAGVSLYLSLVPAYLAATLHASDPLIGAGAFLATQLATIVASIRFSSAPLEKSAIIASAVTIAGLVLLVAGTTTNNWPAIAIGTVLVGGGTGVANGASFGIATRVGRGQRARIFSRLLVVAYLGYSVPVLLTGIVAARTSFATGFIAVTALLAVITLALPFLRDNASRTIGSPTCATSAA